MQTNTRFEAASRTISYSPAAATQPPIDEMQIAPTDDLPRAVPAAPQPEGNGALEIMLGCAFGLLAGASFGAFIAWWFFVESPLTVLVLTVHTGFAGVAMGGWLLPTLRSP